MDAAIRALVKGAAQAAIELVAENAYDGLGLYDIYERREELAEAVAAATMECAEEDPDSEVHAVRAAGGAQPRSRPVGRGSA